MWLKRVILLFVLWLFCGSVSYFKQQIRPVFAVQVSMQTNSQLYTLVAYIHNGRALSHRKVVTKDEFVRIASGYWPSVYNPKKINLFEQNGIPCSLIHDDETNRDIPACSPLDSLWKIRYSDFPYNNGTEKGWSAEMYKPSSKQAVYLHKTYGIYDIDFSSFADTAFWKILKDVQNPNWIRNYRSL